MVALSVGGPTKFAPLIPTDTPTETPTRAVTRRPTRTPITESAPVASPTTGPTGTPDILSAGSVSTVTACAPIPSESYYAFTLNSPPTDRPAAQHPDLNLSLRGYKPVTAYRGLVDLGGDTAPDAPQLSQLFSDVFLPYARGVYQVYDWNWGTNQPGDLITDPPVTFITLPVTPGETMHLPDAGTNIGLGYAALVLYAEPNRITLKYTGEDNAKRGYTLHLENVCVEPRLLALYGQLNAAGRGQLPALRVDQAFGRASGDTIGIAIRDNGTFLDPRSRKDWWKDQ